MAAQTTRGARGLQERKDRAGGRALDADRFLADLRELYEKAQRLADRLEAQALQSLHADVEAVAAGLRLGVGQAELIAAERWRDVREIDAEAEQLAAAEGPPPTQAEVLAAVARYVERLNLAEALLWQLCGTLLDQPRRFSVDEIEPHSLVVVRQLVAADGRDVPDGRSAHVFVCARSGDIFKPSAWSGARRGLVCGNVFRLPHVPEGYVDPVLRVAQ